MAKTKIGRVVPLHMGEYSASKTYALNHLVSYNGSLYWHQSRTETTGVAPTVTSTWTLVVDVRDAEALVQRAETAKTGAETAQASAQSAATSAVSAKQSAESYATQASASASAAETAKSGAETAAQSASSSASSASQSAVDANQHCEDAETAKEAAEAAKDEAVRAKTSAGQSATDAQTAQSAAEAAKDEAVRAKTSAGQSATDAQTAQSAAEAAKDTAVSKAQEAAQSAAEAHGVVDGKVDKNQGVSQKGKALIVGNDGMVTTGEAGVSVDTTLSVAGKAADAKATGDALATKTEKVRIDFDLTGKRFLKGETVLTFAQINTMLQNTPAFVVFVHGKREHRCTLIDMESNPKQMRFVAPVLSDGVLKTQSIYVTSTDGVGVTDMVMSNINCENVSNKVTSFSDASTDAQYPSAKAVNTAMTAVNERLSTLEKKAPNIYGFHVNANEANPSTAVTYLEDAVGMTPAKMDYTNGVFNWGSWGNAFFLPKPCMLKSDGTVAYYLNPNDYSKKADGTDSDITDESFDGNAMMEWGQNGKRIYYAIIPDENSDESYSVYVSDTQVDSRFHCYSFYDKNNELMEHFYTPIYSSSLDSSNKLRSLSGKSLMNSKSGTQEISYAQANGDGWNIEVWADKLLMFLLLYLMGKSLDVQTTYGQGHSTGGSSAASLLTTGSLDSKGLFYGYSSTDKKVKVFGMEDQWGEQWNRVAGLMLNNGVYYYKLTEGTADGSTATGYRTTDTNGMIAAGQSPTANGYVKAFKAVNGNAILQSNVSGGSTTYYCDYFYQSQSGVRFALLGGCSYHGASCGVFVSLSSDVGVASWNVGAALSCKPLAR